MEEEKQGKQKAVTITAFVIGVILFLLFAANDLVRVSGASDEQSQGIIVYWLTGR